MEKINAQIKKVKEVLDGNLAIPNYQRPYRWSSENVSLLLEDISENWRNNKQAYRIGSVILHEAETILNIVDGQQRITTILLVLKALGANHGDTLRTKLKYNHQDSKKAIIDNIDFIKRWIAENVGNNIESFSTYILDNCEFVEIEVTDLSEAFQMFDSQNGRGKELEAYNLLKAYHIRAMEQNTFDEKVICDKTWEGAARYQRQITDGNNKPPTDLLRQLINEQLYRTRRWSRKQIGTAFHKKYIAEFKGVSIGTNQAIDFPFQNRDLLQHIVQNYFSTLGVSVNGIKPRFANHTINDVSPFSLINQNIINGKPYFEYIQTYVEIYKRLFYGEFPEMQGFKAFVKKYCKYDKSHRDGDRYLFELYKSLIMLVFDKFGEDGVERFYKTLYLLVYRQRLEKMQVRYDAVAKYPTESNFFHVIERAKTYQDFAPLEKLAYKEVVCNKVEDIIIAFFQDQGVKLTAGNRDINLSKYPMPHAN